MAENETLCVGMFNTTHSGSGHHLPPPNLTIFARDTRFGLVASGRSGVGNGADSAKRGGGWMAGTGRHL